MRTKVTFFLAFFVASSAFSAVDFEDVTFGFNNGYKSGKWALLNVTVRSQNEPTTFDGEITVEVRGTNPDKTTYRYATPLHLSKTDRKHKKLYIYYPKTKVKLLMQLVRSERYDQKIETSISEPRAIQEIIPPTPIANKDYFVLVLAPNGDKLQKIINKKQLTDDGTQVHIKYLPNSHAMPTRWIGYNAVDLVVIREVSLTERRVSKQQQAALLDWVQRGGTLVVSGGSNFRNLRDSFIEQFLPVKLIQEETIDKVPSTLQQQFGFGTKDNAISTFKSIKLEPKPECHTLLGTDEQIYIAKRHFGSGQIICFAFDYNAPPFSELNSGETFWRWLLKTHGKSPRFFADRYAPFRQHEEEIHKQFLLKMPTQIPLIKFLAIVLPVYLLSVGGLLLYSGKRGRSTQNKARRYWIGGLILVLASVSAIGVARAMLPKKIETDQFSILSIYPERENAHVQTYVSLRATAHTKTSISLTPNTFVRPLRIENVVKSAQFGQGSTSQLQEVTIEPWSPSTYVKETYFPLDTQKTPIKLENTWKIKGQEATYLGEVTLGKSDLWSPNSPRETLKKLPPHEGLDETRKTFAQILQREGLLQYLSKLESLLPMDMDKPQFRTVVMGWIAELDQFSTAIPPMSVEKNVTIGDETLVILYLGHSTHHLKAGACASQTTTIPKD